jgi:S-DNA-T family DNA segregation ATPase FtsK/SpoIIIE
VLVDFKGGATFAGMADMPHVSAVITNLAKELTLVDRMQDALSGEMTRRQELLREAGNFGSLRDYEKARASGEDLEPLPSLLIVVDEFSELLSAKPEFIDLFVAIGRLGRSLGSAPAAGLAAPGGGPPARPGVHLSYRIGLRTFSAAESRSVIGVPDAYELPAGAGTGFLKPDQSTLWRFKAAYVSGPPEGRARGVARRGWHPEHLPFTGPGATSRAELESWWPRCAAPSRPEEPATHGRASTSRSTGWRARDPRPTRSGCRRSTSRTPSTS